MYISRMRSGLLRLARNSRYEVERYVCGKVKILSSRKKGLLGKAAAANLLHLQLNILIVVGLEILRLGFKLAQDNKMRD